VQALRATADRLGHAHLETRGGKIETVAPRLAEQGLRFHTNLINPMRSSLGPIAMQALSDLTERRLLYLAPAPRAGAEDIGLLVANGWRATHIGFANYHPGTGHAMMAICMERDL
jgi:tRNA/tmRNA/rRNA uracil-C5-methylase (TrmA/RlmC/RlmD family)